MIISLYKPLYIRNIYIRKKNIINILNINFTTKNNDIDKMLFH